MRLLTFIIALLLLGGAVGPTRGWLIALVVLAGLAAVRWRSWRPFSLRPAFDVRLATFVVAVLLLAGVIEPTRGWLIGLSIAAGIAMVMPRLFSVGPAHEGRWAPTRARVRVAHRRRGSTPYGWDEDGWR
ncbi:MAG: hypothetical protein KGK07_12500 [Chloroflexota bacterium]|nr:hypothetical protein [Chloroflexota bacterium]